MIENAPGHMPWRVSFERQWVQIPIRAASETSARKLLTTIRAERGILLHLGPGRWRSRMRCRQIAAPKQNTLNAISMLASA